MKKIFMLSGLLLMVTMLSGFEKNEGLVQNHAQIPIPLPQPTSRDTTLGTVIFELDVQTPTGDNQLLGVEFDGRYFYVTGGSAGADPNKVYVIDTLGTLIWTMNQPVGTGWGWRDLAWDGVYSGTDRIDTLYAGIEGSQVHKFGIDLTTGTLNYYGAFAGPVSVCRALANKPDSSWFFTANWDPCTKFSRTNPNIQTVAGPGSVYGAAYDSDSNWIWWHSQNNPGTNFSAQIDQMEPNAMTWPGVSFGYTPTLNPPDPANNMAGGLCYRSNFHGMNVLFALLQGSTCDEIVGIFLRWVPQAATHDVGTTSIDMAATVPLNTTLAPVASVANFGDTAETFDVACAIEPGGYSSTFNVVDLAPGETTQVEFPDSFTFVSGFYTMTVFTQLGTDIDLTNDTLSATIEATGIAEGNNVLPKEFRFEAPVICNGQFNLELALPTATHIDLTLYDVSGQLCGKLASGTMSAGYHVMDNRTTLANGIYFLRLETGTGISQNRKLLVVR